MGSRNAASEHGSSKSKRNSQPSGGSRGSRAQQKNAQPQGPSFLDERARDDLIGVALAVIGIVLFVAVIAPGEAVLSNAISSGLLHVLGKGAYVLPFAFIIWGVSYFLKTEDDRIGRLVVGIVFILLSIMTLLSLYNPLVVDGDAGTLFIDTVLTSGGGFVGSAVAWALMSLFGRIIACIIMCGLAIAGLILIGFSISTPILFVRNLIFQNDDESLADGFEPDVKRGKQLSLDGPETTEHFPVGDRTVQLGNKLGRRKRLKKGSSEKTVDLAASSNTLDLGSADPDATIALGTDSKRQGAKVTKSARKNAPSKSAVGVTPTALEGFELPSRQLLHVSGKRQENRTSELKQTAALLQQTLEEFNLPVDVVGWLAGPTVTMFKVDLPSGVKLSKLTNLQDDIALALAASAVRIAQIPNTSLVGVEIPNRTRSTVYLGDVLGAAKEGPLQLAIGEDVDGQNICADLAKMPHLLIGGTTGSGKSVAINSILMSVLMRATPAEVRMVLIDPKRVELSLYNGIPHLYVPVVTEPKEAASALRWAVIEMERRLKVFEQAGARNIGLYNQMIQEGRLDGDEGQRPAEMPFIMIVIDELSDLMMVAGKDVEDSIVRISQLARAAGIHLIVATQRPSSNIITGMIKDNITDRIAFNVATNVASRVIIDQSGAEKLVGLGDMLFSKHEWGKPKRIQGCFVGEDEISAVVEHLRAQGEPDYHTEILQTRLEGGSAGSSASMGSSASDDDDPLLWEAAEAVVSAGLGSTSMLQRRLKVGYARAGRIMDMLENKGVVGPQDGSRAREVLVDSLEDIDTIRAFEEQDKEGL